MSILNTKTNGYFTSWLLPPLALSLLRALISLYIFLSIFLIWGWYGTHNKRAQIGHSFSYFTWLTYWGLGFYFLFAAIHTATYALTGRALLDRWPRVLKVLHAVFYTTITTLPFLVTIVFWAILFRPPWYSVTFTGWQNISQHALNSLYALLELFLPTTPTHPILTLPCLIFLLLLYVSLAYLIFHTEGFYTYSFLDPKRDGSGIVAGYCFGILAAILVIFGLSWGVIWIRNRLVKGRVKRSVHDREAAGGVQEMEVATGSVEVKA